MLSPEEGGRGAGKKDQHISTTHGGGSHVNLE